MERVWSGRDDGATKVARAFLKQLCAKLGDGAAAPAWIFNVRGIRYRMTRLGEPRES